MTKPAPIKAVRAWAVIEDGQIRRSAIWPSLIVLYANEKEAQYSCSKLAGERVIPVRIVPVEEKP